MKTIEEKNRIIAEFMGATFYEDTKHWYDEEGGYMGELNLLYDKEWSWLMDVVDKIETINDGAFDVNILKNGTQIFEYSANGRDIVDNVGRISYENKIEHTYQAIVEFIEWYNKNN